MMKYRLVLMICYYCQPWAIKRDVESRLESGMNQLGSARLMLQISITMRPNKEWESLLKMVHSSDWERPISQWLIDPWPPLVTQTLPCLIWSLLMLVSINTVNGYVGIPGGLFLIAFLTLTLSSSLGNPSTPFPLLICTAHNPISCCVFPGNCNYYLRSWLSP